MKFVLSPLVVAVLLSGALFAQNSNSHVYNNLPAKSVSTQMISNGPVAETVSDSSAYLGWSTKESENKAVVRYGTNRDHLMQSAQASDTIDGKNHHVRLENLSSDTVYYFQVTENGEPVGGIGTFRTVAEGEKPVQSKAVISQK